MTEMPKPESFVVEIEQDLLGSIMQSGELPRIAGIIRADHFVEPLHGFLFGYFQSAYDRYGSITPAVILKLIPEEDRRAWEARLEISLSAYLANLVAGCMSGGRFIERSARKVVEQAGRLKIASEAKLLAEAAADPNSDPMQLITSCGRAFDDIASDVRAGPKRKTRVAFAEAAGNAFSAAETARKRGSGLTGITWGLTDVNRLTGGMQRRDLTLIGARPSMGKAQPLTAKVRTPRGWTAMGNLRVGDQVSSVDGTPSIITGAFPQGVKQIYRITFSDGRSTRCCGDHLWRVHYRNWDGPRVLSTLELIEKLSRARYKHRLWIDQIEPSGVDDPSLPLDPWVLGALLGDGGLTGGAVKFSTACAETLDRMASRLPNVCRIDPITGTKYDHVVTMREKVRLSSGRLQPNSVVEAIKELGLNGHRSEAKFIPRQYLDAGPAQRLDLLRGLLDTDGWVERHGSVCFCTTSNQLADDVCELARSLGAWCSIRPRRKFYTYKGEKKAGLPAYTCVIGHPDPASLFLMTAKVGATKDRSRRKLPIIVKVEQDGFENAQCISVSHPSKLYVTDDYVVTHNTTLGLSVGINAAKSGVGVGFVSLEMDADKLASRGISDLAYDRGLKIPYSDIVKGRVDEQALSALNAATESMRNLPLIIEDQSGLSITDIRVKTEIMMEQCQQAGTPLGVLFIDHLGLIRASSRYSGNRVHEITEMTGLLKGLAREYDIAVILLSQLNRAVEGRDNKRPQLSDLRDSGSIEQDADTIMFLYREAYYLEREKGGGDDKAERAERLIDCQNKLELIIAKQRNGPLGTVDLFADMGCAAIRNGARQ